MEKRMKVFSWLQEQFKKDDKLVFFSEHEWECIEDHKVPRWLLRAYNNIDTHHDGLIYRFNGKHYQYKVVESGQGGAVYIFYRRLKWNRILHSKSDSGKSKT
jgi:hypothetical protein